MDKETLSHYGWIVVLVLILSVMIALATPFGNFIANGVSAITTAFTQSIGNSLGFKVGKLSITPIDKNLYHDVPDIYDIKIPDAVSQMILASDGSMFLGNSVNLPNVKNYEANINKNENSKIYKDIPLTAVINYNNGSSDIVNLTQDGGSLIGSYATTKFYANVKMSDLTLPQKITDTVPVSVIGSNGETISGKISYVDDTGWFWYTPDGIMVAIEFGYYAEIENGKIIDENKNDEYAIIMLVDGSPSIDIVSFTVDGNTFSVNKIPTKLSTTPSFCTNIKMSEFSVPKTTSDTIPVSITGINGEFKEGNMHYLENNIWVWQHDSGFAAGIILNHRAEITDGKITGGTESNEYATIMFLDSFPDIDVTTFNVDGNKFDIANGNELSEGKLYYSNSDIEISVTLSKKATEDGLISDSNDYYYFEYKTTKDIEIHNIRILNKTYNLPQGYMATTWPIVEFFPDDAKLTNVIYSFNDGKQVSVPISNNKPINKASQLTTEGLTLNNDIVTGYCVNPENISFITFEGQVNGDNFALTHAVYFSTNYYNLDKYLYYAGEEVFDNVIISISGNGSEAVIATYNNTSDGIMRNVDISGEFVSVHFPQFTGPFKIDGKEPIKKMTIKEGVTVVKSLDTLEKLEEIYIAETVTDIQSTCSKCTNLKVYGKTGTYAETWATQNGHVFIAQ